MMSIVAYINIAIAKFIDSKFGIFVFPAKRRPKKAKPHIAWAGGVCIFLLFIIPISPMNTAHSTTIVALASSSFVVLGADSMIKD